jgi:PHS family inorganic phosphate transporter-like MFS transporter
MPEGKKYTESQELNTPVSSSSSVRGGTTSATPQRETTAHDMIMKNYFKGKNEIPEAGHPNPQKLTTLPTEPVGELDLENLTVPQTRKAKLDTFFIYVSEWRHLKTLIGTASCWFLLDVAFYGTNLNQSVLLVDIGFSTGATHYDVLMRNAIGNLIIAVAGYVPGYFVTIALIEKLGRRWIQIQGFLVCALMFGILAGGYVKLSTAGKFVCFAIAQVGSIYHPFISSPRVLSISLT